MKIVCVGPGAMGCLFAALLKRAGQDVALMDYRQERAQILTEKGIQVNGLSGSFHVRVPVTTKPDLHDKDLIIVCVKAGKTAEVARQLAGKIGARSLVLSLQNGLGNIEILSETIGKHRTLGGVTSEGATLLAPGHVRHAGKGQTFIGTLSGRDSEAAQVASIFSDAGLQAYVSDNVTGLIWGKLIINVGINAITAITRLRNGMLAELDETRELMNLAVNEAVAVAKAKGIDLPYPDPLSRVLEVCKATANNVASMLQDVLNRRPTEVDCINGAVVREAMRLGLPAPVNTALTQIVKAVEKTYEMQVN